VAFGPGGRIHPDARGASMHAFGEHVLVDDCVAAAKIYLALALDLCNRPPPEESRSSAVPGGGET
jgi:acetylornithine deacetylase/succinyl-diaminopimelate desuccinylase-like protein